MVRIQSNKQTKKLKYMAGTKLNTTIFTFHSPMLSAASAPVEVKVTNVEAALLAGRSTSKAMVAASERAASQMMLSRLPKRRHKLIRTLTSLFKILMSTLKVRPKVSDRS